MIILRSAWFLVTMLWCLAGSFFKRLFRGDGFTASLYLATEDMKFYMNTKLQGVQEELDELVEEKHQEADEHEVNSCDPEDVQDFRDRVDETAAEARAKCL